MVKECTPRLDSQKVVPGMQTQSCLALEAEILSPPAPRVDGIPPSRDLLAQSPCMWPLISSWVGGTCPVIKQEQAKLLTALSRPGGRGPPKSCFWVFVLAWHKHVGEMSLHHSGIPFQVTNGLGSPWPWSPDLSKEATQL